MNTEFPKSDKQFLKTQVFQDQEIPLIFRGWTKKANADRVKDGAVVATWKNQLKYVLRYSYPEWALDEAGEKIIKDGKPVRNRNYDPEYPKGYTIVYHFDEGQLDTGSLPLFNAFCLVRPKVGDVLLVGKTGKDKETKWSVKKIKDIHAVTGELPTVDFSAPEFSADPNPDEDEIPF